MTNHLKGLLITGIGVLCIVPDSLFVRLIDTDSASIAFWRALIAGTIILIGVLLTSGLTGFRHVAHQGPMAFIYAALMGVSSAGFVLAVTLTSVANVVLILASMPIFAALFSRIFLGEALSRRMILTIAGVLIGVLIIVKGSHEVAVANWRGDLVAIAVSAAFAAAMTIARSLKSVSLVPMIPIALVGSSFLLWPLASPLETWLVYWPYLLMHGVLIALSTSLITLGPRYLSSPEVALMMLLESVLAPLLVWFVLKEHPGSLALIGGAVLMAVLVSSNLWALRHRKRA